LYSDATTLDALGKSTEHPVFLTLGNISIRRRNQPDAKVLLGYLPSLKASTKSEKRSTHFVLAKRQLFHQCYKLLTKDILKLQQEGFNLWMDSGLKWVYPFITQVIGDLPEDASICLTFESAQANRPCHTCLVTHEELNKRLSKEEIIIRTPENMQQAIRDNKAKEYCIYKIDNIFWAYRQVFISEII
jgi:hypothetical protein